MGNPIVYECIRQLIKVYALAEEQYIQTASQTYNPILRNFLEQRAFERFDFIEQIQREVYPIANHSYLGSTTEELYNWHRQLFGRNALNRQAITAIEEFIIDEKAEEICTCLLTAELPYSIKAVLRGQLIKLEASVLSMLYLWPLYKR